MADNSSELQGQINLLEGGLAEANKPVQPSVNNPNPLNAVDEELKELDHPDTLDESVYQTLKRDFIKIVHKLEQVMIPKTTAEQSKNLKNCKRNIH